MSDEEWLAQQDEDFQAALKRTAEHAAALSQSTPGYMLTALIQLTRAFRRG